MIQCVALEQGQDDIRQAAGQTEKDHGGDQALHFGKVGDDPANAKEFQFFGFSIFHYRVTSSMPLWAS